jgi:hypothetical protein
VFWIVAVGPEKTAILGLARLVSLVMVIDLKNLRREAASL